jgi:hypothetical protein
MNFGLKINSMKFATACKVLNCGAGEECRRSVGEFM